MILVVTTLDRIGIPYMITGSIVSSSQGEPRSTHDIDILIRLRPEQISGLVRSFPDTDFYLSEAAVREAIQTESMFNLLHFESGDKVDFWILTTEPYDVVRFKRRTQQPLSGTMFQCSTPEDTILMKLRWGLLSGGSERQFHDVQRIYEVQFGALDLGYVESWIDRLNVREQWERMCRLANVIDRRNNDGSQTAAQRRDVHRDPPADDPGAKADEGV